MVQVYKGKLDCIELSVATRSGNKKVTLVNNLDTYQVRPPPGQSGASITRPAPD